MLPEHDSTFGLINSGKVLVIDEVQQIHPDLGWPENLG